MKPISFLVRLGSCALVLASLAAVDQAQSSPSRTTFARYGRPLRSATLDLGTGTVTRAPVPRDRSASTVVDFANNDLGGFTGVDSGNGFCEWIQAGTKGGAGNTSDLMNSIVFAYCSSKLSAQSGGPGGSVVLGFYEGYTTGGATPTTTVAALTLTGLPANTGSSSFFGGFRCFFIRIVFQDLVCYRDGPIGYSWRFTDSGTGVINPLGAAFAGTWPFLACSSSCSGGGGGGGPAVNGIDRYCPPGTFLSTFTFGTVSGSFSSISMDIEEVTDAPSTVMNFNSATFPNPDLLTADAATVGQPWTATLTQGFNRAASQWVLYFGTSKVNPPNGVPVPLLMAGLNFGPSKAGKMILCALNTNGVSIVTPHTGVLGSTSTTAPVTIPKQLGLVCNEWCSQAIVLGAITGAGNARMSSMVAGTVGSVP